MSAVLDLRLNTCVKIRIDEGVAYQPSIDGITNLDTGYTFTINGLTKTVGAGLTLTADGIIIEIDNTDFPAGEYKGFLVSDSKQAGIYLRIEIEVFSYAPGS